WVTSAGALPSNCSGTCRSRRKETACSSARRSKFSFRRCTIRCGSPSTMTCGRRDDHSLPPLDRDAYDELCAYTLTHGDPSFIHQHVVDAFAAQHADASSKPIGVTFALVGLYLQLEKHFSGREVQRVHMQLARRKRVWPAFVIPSRRGAMTAIDVM